MSRALSAPASVTPQPSMPLGRTPSAAPTVITFLAVALGVDGARSREPPSLPAANTSTISWLPAVPDCASRTSWSYCGGARACTTPQPSAVPVPHELFEMRAPSFQALAASVAGEKLAPRRRRS